MTNTATITTDVAAAFNVRSIDASGFFYVLSRRYGHANAPEYVVAGPLSDKRDAEAEVAAHLRRIESAA